jgi:glycosyltransferase involved in cell wall biosynthesis
MSEITVIVPTYGGGLYLSKVVDALMAQRPHIPQIIVVHSGGRSPKLLQTRQTDRIRILHSDERLYAGAARNWGMTFAETSWITFIDDDMIVIDGWYKAVLGAIESDRADCYLGSISCAVSGGYWGMCRWFFEHGPGHPYLPPTQAITGGAGNLTIRREAFLSTGAFPVDWQESEDVMGLARFALEGHKIKFEPHIMGGHVNRPGFLWNARRLFHFGQSTAKVRRVYPFLAGGSAVRFPILAPGLWIARIAQLYRRVILHKGPLGSLVCHTPGIVLIALVWNAGFITEVLKPSRKRSTN